MAEIFGNTTTTPIKPDLFRNKVDSTFNPESHNPQSGVALAPVLQKKFEFWQPNTEYKVGDVVIGSLHMGYYLVTNILVCKVAHLSGSEMMDTVTASDYWDFNPVNAYESSIAAADGTGNIIHETYATKEELNTVMGDIAIVLDDIIDIQNFLINGGDDV